MSKHQQLLEGKYNYIKEGKTFCEEIFTFQRDEKFNGNYKMEADVLARVDTGEFLKIQVEYETTYQYEPLRVRIKRSLGKKESLEEYWVDHKDKVIHYRFHVDSFKKETEGYFNTKFHIITPAFSTMMLMALNKKVDPVHRTVYTTFSTNNVWEYEGTFQEQNLYLESLNHEPVNVKVRGNELQAHVYALFDGDKSERKTPEGSKIYASKYYMVPYKAELAEEIVIEIEKLKNLESAGVKI